MTSQGSNAFSRYEELAHQKRTLEIEEVELTKQRKQVLLEKDRVTRQLRRLETREELIAREDQVKKQRLILEIEKKKLREEI